MGEGNPFAGEVALTLDGERHLLKLTLGALAELEATLEANSLVALVDRFETGGFSARDVAAVLLAGLRGGGWRGQAATLLGAEIEGGPMEATRVAALLLGRAFALPGR
ncbi:gene transfer agent family protein [Jannaschia marina]|uniref:gene transfer agent family protein n=1 Tax=Jannaschia marina TaxID=2741674 RepID=UPI0015CE5D08|nr:gene transfer agent family protein [Jannaschia marina]